MKKIVFYWIIKINQLKYTLYIIMMIKIMQKEDIFDILEKDFPDIEMNTANEVEVHKYMR